MTKGWSKSLTEYRLYQVHELWTSLNRSLKKPSFTSRQLKKKKKRHQIRC